MKKEEERIFYLYEIGVLVMIISRKLAYKPGSEDITK